MNAEALEHQGSSAWWVFSELVGTCGHKEQSNKGKESALAYLLE
ncbi:hypothetical protein cauri_1632 [Corynebacterium aurimucosum ATCC 700975]|uniref:Uncharacterized protein n=1 Tax=Corynebacterium aurimucosum (strain ATCC 700975 / DSM 44827 / CIP 107346 / CN-1) TaxID=548476 RepID=C3PHC1_CORA7|nr:hypothetical protein cauri_1632 [Corynebacterium aurimucosum ATCC 700975]